MHSSLYLAMRLPASFEIILMGFSSPLLNVSFCVKIAFLDIGWIPKQYSRTPIVSVFRRCRILHGSMADMSSGANVRPQVQQPKSGTKDGDCNTL